MPQINDTIVPDGLYNEASTVARMGGKCWLAIPDGVNNQACTNCNGSTKLVLQVVAGGPFEAPTPAGIDTSLISDNGRWYLVKTRPYTCPTCNGVRTSANGRVVRGSQQATAQLAAAMEA